MKLFSSMYRWYEEGDQAQILNLYDLKLGRGLASSNTWGVLDFELQIIQTQCLGLNRRKHYTKLFLSVRLPLSSGPSIDTLNFYLNFPWSPLKFELEKSFETKIYLPKNVLSNISSVIIYSKVRKYGNKMAKPRSCAFLDLWRPLLVCTNLK